MIVSGGDAGAREELAQGREHSAAEGTRQLQPRRGHLQIPRHWQVGLFRLRIRIRLKRKIRFRIRILHDLFVIGESVSASRELQGKLALYFWNNDDIKVFL